MKKLVVLIFLFVMLGGFWIVYRMYNKPHRDPSTESSIQISAVELFRSFEKNETAANGLYLDKVLAVNGDITEITINQEQFPVIVLKTENSMFTVRCTMDKTVITAKVGDRVIIKGICTGYLSDVIIVKGILVD